MDDPKEETERTIAKYKEANKQFIKKNQYVYSFLLFVQNCFCCSFVCSQRTVCHKNDTQ